MQFAAEAQLVPSIMGAAELLRSSLAQTLGQAGKGAGFAMWEEWGCPDAL